MALKPAVNQVNLLLLLLQEQGELASTGDEVPYTTCERPIVRSLANWKKHKLCFFRLASEQSELVLCVHWLLVSGVEAR